MIIPGLIESTHPEVNIHYPVRPSSISSYYVVKYFNRLHLYVRNDEIKYVNLTLLELIDLAYLVDLADLSIELTQSHLYS